MKRIVLITGAILLSLVLRAQSVTYTCRYWFDQNDAQAVTTTFSENTWQVEWDVGTLTKGLHTLHVQAADTSSAWCSPLSYMFLKLSPTEPLLDTVDMSNLTYHCWFDQDDAHQQTGSLGNGIFMFDVSDLEEGLHSVNIMLEGSTLTSTQNYMFIKVAQQEPLIEPIDMSHLVYHCWFDQDYENRVVDSVSAGSFLLDVSDLDEGLHSVNIMLVGEALTSVQNYMFIKVAQQAPLIDPIDMSHLVYHCWFDEDYENRVTDSISNGIILLDVENIGDGLHTVHILLEGEAMTSTQTYMFLKKPQQQDFGIAKWQYYLNGDVSQIHTTEISPVIDTLDIITLLSVETWPVRSSCFHFHPNGDEPYLNAKNEITFLFWSNDNHLLKKSEFYVDYQVTETIEADTLERNSTVCIAAPRDNFIKWYKLPLEYGDTVAFKADKACIMQLFAPSGEEVYTATAGEALVFGGCHAYEDGDYYLAVHDVTGSGDELCLTNVFVHKYAILAYDVHLVGNGGCSTITFQGNGFNNLLDVYLVNAQNDTIPRLDIGHESNTTTTVTFNFYEVNLGVYDAVFQFYDETIRINGALEVQEPVDIVLTSSVSYPSQFLRNTACTYTYTITNNGNMTAYDVPLNIYIATESERGISHLAMEGLILSPLYDYLKDLYDWSNVERNNLMEFSEYMGEDHYFIRSYDVDENTGDTILIRSGIFSIEIPPYSTREITLQLTASESVDVWFSNPNESFPRTSQEFRDGELPPWHFCCWHSDAETVFNGASAVYGGLSVALTAAAAAVAGASVATALFGLEPVALGEGAAAANLAAMGLSAGFMSCVHGAAAGLIAELGDAWCGHKLSGKDRGLSFFGTIAGCVPTWGGLMNTVRPLLQTGGSVLSALGASVGSYSSAHTPKDPRCTDEPPKGGQSSPVNSLDPNDIRGYLSESDSHYMRQEIQNIHYEIEFENDTTLATAAAHTIIVRDTLDATKFDLNSLAARSVTIGDKRLELNGEQTFARTLDMRPELYVIAQIEQDYDPTTGIVEWTIQSLDPMTMEPTDNPYQGVLPVNYFGNGVGFIDYSINLKQAFADGTEVSNRAGIIFDQEAVIMTPTWTNVIDAVKPTSYIEEVTPVADSLNFSFISEDSRSGVWYHSLYYRNDSTDQQWQVRKAQIFEDSYMLHLEDLQTTEYLVMAVDSAGNMEDKLMNAEYVFSLDSIVYYTLTVSDPQGCGEVRGSGSYLAGSHVTIEAIPDNNCYFLQWNDGITDNPRVVHLVQDTTFVAMFEFNYSEITQTTTFTEGWNWWSTYIEQDGIDGLSLLEEGLGTYGIVIKSQSDGYTEYYDDYDLWYGSLNAINNESSYMVKTYAPCQVSMTGPAAVPSQHPITVDANGWTWIGYPVAYDMDINMALDGLAAIEGDMLKAQEGYAEFYEGYGWFGPLETLTSGKGYMYKSTNASPATFTYPDNGRTAMRDNITGNDNHWVPVASAYPFNMTVTAVVELDGEELRSDRYELAAFANGESRGSVRLMYVEPIDRYVAFLTIAGEEAADLSFALYDTETGMECFPAEESVAFEANATVGRIGEPFVVSFRGTTGMDELANSLRVYPNPVKAGERFSICMNAESKAPVRVEIVNALGVTVSVETSTQAPASIMAPATAGVYTLRVTVDGKGTAVRKLVVK